MRSIGAGIASSILSNGVSQNIVMRPATDQGNTRVVRGQSAAARALRRGRGAGTGASSVPGRRNRRRSKRRRTKLSPKAVTKVSAGDHDPRLAVGGAAAGAAELAQLRKLLLGEALEAGDAAQVVLQARDGGVCEALRFRPRRRHGVDREDGLVGMGLQLEAIGRVRRADLAGSLLAGRLA